MKNSSTETIEPKTTQQPWCFLCLFLLSVSCNWSWAQTFTDVTDVVGLTLTHQSSQTVVAIEDHADNTIQPLVGYHNWAQLMSSWMTGGVAAGDYDNDGWQDLFVIGGDLGQSKLFRNAGNGQFIDVTQSVGLGAVSGRIAGAVFADYDGDGDLDLFLGAVLGELPQLWNNQVSQHAGFVEMFAVAFPDFDVSLAPNTWGMTFGDINNDGCLDVFMPHSMTPKGPQPRLSGADGSGLHLWKNNCNGQFVDISASAQISQVYDDINYNASERDQTMAAQFTDLNEDGYVDLVVASDINASLVFINNQNETFSNATDRVVINDKHGMGSAVGDMNGDGHMDWFTANIGAPLEGNKLYLGSGAGTFTNASQGAGLVEGHWAWGTCVADFNADRLLDVFHVNGFYFPNNDNPNASNGRYDQTPAVLFMANGDGTYTESAASFGLNDSAEGRGVSCFDYDRDGDIDIAIANYKGEFKLFRNDLQPSQNNFLNIRLRDYAPNSQSVGARITVSSEVANETGALVQEIYAGGNFNSSNPAVAYFGLGDWQGPLTVHVQPLNQANKTFTQVLTNQSIQLDLRADLIFTDGFD